jgi:hypothetical protein
MSKHFEEIDVSEGESRFGEEPASSTALERYDSSEIQKDGEDGLSKRKKAGEVVIQDV